MRFKHLLLCLLSLSVLFIAGCKDNEEEAVNAGRYGMMSTDTPQYNAILFMRAIYNDKSLERAKSLSTDRFARILANHHTNKNVQRHMLNLRLDQMIVEPVSGGTLIYSDLQKEAEIEVKIDGKYDNEKVLDLKTIHMVRENGKWLVTEVEDTIP